ncbi:MAG: hypothetical protein JJU18_06205 [Oceanicaulis sp.]|nr:hypothetical protein [Oceanicaulis sp.]
MRLLPPDDGPPKDGFKTFDLFNRRALADTICNSFAHFDDNRVVLVNGAWGSGKTYFIKQFENHSQDCGFYPIYFDAHEYDYTKDALGSILSEFANHANQLIDDVDAISILADSAGRVALAGLRGLAMGVAEVATAGVASQVKGRVETALSTPERLSSAVVNRVLDTRDAMSCLRDSITDIASRISRTSKKEPLIIIDEIDRCRPDFALEVIEIVKHIFPTSGVRFIISADLENLKSIVNVYYASNFDSNNYLMKFYNVRFDVSEYKSRNKHILDAYGEYHERECLQPLTESLTSACAILKISAKKNGFTIRQMQRCYQYLALSYCQLKDGSFDAAPPFVFISLALASGGNIPTKIRNNQLIMKDVTNLLGIDEGDESGASRFILSYFEYIFNMETKDEWSWASILSRYNFVEESDSLRIVLEKYFDNFSPP